MTAQLVQLYDKAGPERKFEIILFGMDDSQNAMEAYMRDSHMAFPAVRMELKSKLESLARTSNSGSLPNVALVTREGKLVTGDIDQVLAILSALPRSLPARPTATENR